MHFYSVMELDRGRHSCRHNTHYAGLGVKQEAKFSITHRKALGTIYVEDFSATRRHFWLGENSSPCGKNFSSTVLVDIMLPKIKSKIRVSSVWMSNRNSCMIQPASSDAVVLTCTYSRSFEHEVLYKYVSHGIIVNITVKMWIYYCARHALSQVPLTHLSLCFFTVVKHIHDMYIYMHFIRRPLL